MQSYIMIASYIMIPYCHGGNMKKTFWIRNIVDKSDLVLIRTYWETKIRTQGYYFLIHKY